VRAPIVNPEDTTPVVICEALSRRFGSLRAVESLSLTIPPGEIFGLLGPNGAGKTTTIKMLTTLISPSSGRAIVAGFDVAREPSRVRRAIGYVPQLISADAQVTGFENLWVVAGLYEIPRKERRARAEEALELMGLEPVANVLVKNYSGGMIRRLEMAQALMHRPRVLFLDEPTVGLDPVARDAVWEQIDLLRRRFGTAIVVTTHYMEEADRLCERIGVLHRGHLVALGSPAELKAGLGRPSATLGDVFTHYAGAEVELGGAYREAGRTRRVAARLE
jgi:ABC-2 type transport system ATP-binding protein